MFKTKFRAICLLGAVGATVPAAMNTDAADVTLGWDAATYDGDGTWEVNAFDAAISGGATVRWFNGTTQTKNTGSTNFVNINDFVSTPDFTLNRNTGGGDSFDEIRGDAATDADASWELVFRPGDFTGTEAIIETGGTGDGTVLRMIGNNLNFRFQDGPNAGEFLELNADLSLIGSASDFYHVVAVADLNNATSASAIYVNGVQVASGGNTSSVGDWAGTDGAGLGKVVGTSPQGATYTGNFGGDVAIIRHYGEQISSPGAVKNLFSATTGNRSSATLGWDAADYNSDGTWEVSEFDASLAGADNVVWRSGSGTKNSGTTNFANVNDWISSPSFVQGQISPSPGSGAFDAVFGNGFAQSDTTFEAVFRPGDYDENEKHLIFDHGGNGQGVLLELEGSTLTFTAQNNPGVDKQVTQDLSLIATADNFFHIIAVVDTDNPNTESGLYINGQLIGTLGGTSLIPDWAGGDFGALGADVTGSTANGDTGGFTAFDGDIAIYRIYNDQAFDQAAVDAAFAALVPEPSSMVLLGMGGLALLRRRRG